MQNEQKNLLVLGAGSSEIDVIKYAKTMNLRVFATDSNTDWRLAPAKNAADEAWDISWSDIPALAAKCRECSIDGVFAGFSEKRVGCAIKLCKELHLPFYTDGSKTELIFNKPAFMRLCSEVGFTIPRQYGEADEVEYPVIVKPNGSASSLGIAVCRSEEEYRDAIQKGVAYSSDGTLEIESYIQNADEMIVWYLVRGGCISLVQTCDMYMKVLDPSKPQIPLGFRFPSKHSQLLAESYDGLFRKLIEKCEIVNGLIGFQCLIKNGEIIPYDPTYRVDSTMVHHITEWMDGSNSLKMLINYSICGSMDDGGQESMVHGDRAGKIIYLLPVFVHDGTIAEIKGLDEIKRAENMIAIFENYSEGDTVSKTSVFSSLFATITFAVDNEGCLMETLNAILNKLVVADASGENMVMKVDYESLVGLR